MEIFDKFKNETRRLELYQTKQLITEADLYTIKGENVGCYIPLRWTLKILLEIPGCFKLLKSSMENLLSDKNIISNFIQADLWTNILKEFDKDKFLVPLFMYFDDIEVGNTLGSHAGKNKLGAVYFSIPCFPTYITAKLNNIIVNGIFFSKDRETYGNPPVFHKVVGELNHLREHGLEITVNNVKHKIHFQLALLLVDNLGLNSLMGFSENFNSNCPCRICKAFIDQIRTLVEEKESLMRTKEGYMEDSKKKNFALTGIVETSIFNRIKGFHVVVNIIMDIMHDLFEGFGNDALVKILCYLIYEKNYFDLAYVNQQLKNFSYGMYVEGNKIPPIKKEHLVVKEKLKMSAAELMCFIRYFGVLFADKVREDDPVWKLYLKLRQIVDIVTSPRLVKVHYVQFESLAEEFLTQYKSHFGDLKFKFHNLPHYLRVMKNNGPLVLFWCMRYESKHRILKMIAITANSTVNILKTVALRCQLMLAYTCLFEDFLTLKIEYDSSGPIDNLTKLLYFSEIDSETFELNKVSINGIDYGTGSVLVIEMNEEIFVKFGKIVRIFLVNDSEVQFQVKILKYETFDYHCHAYEVSEPKCARVMIRHEDLPKVHPCLLNIRQSNEGEKLYVVTKYIL